MKENKRIAVFLGHPAHFHMFKHMTTALEQNGYEVDYLVKRKDMLEELVRNSGHKYYIIRKRERSLVGKWGLIWALISMEMNVILYIIRHRPRMLVGTYAPIISHLTGVTMIVCCEDDAEVVPRFAKTSYPYADCILTPVNCSGGKWDSKVTKYYGFQKLAYLHPNVFEPSWSIVAPILRNPSRPFALLRFAQLRAHHDEGISGITNQVAKALIERLSKKYDVYITSERSLTPELEPYRITIDPMDIHHVLSFASLYIGDSQSMAVEAAMLGTPGIRFNSFAGRIGVLEELEHKYGLTYAIPSSEPQELYDKVEELMLIPDLREAFQQRRNKMLSEKIDVTAFFTWFIENYPESRKVMKENPDYQWRFR
ncbi:MAG: hypothetical protein IKW82_06480 [Bacteroidales bacterium]|nr:hypothetical protein [Bacteroidales bacterium]